MGARPERRADVVRYPELRVVRELPAPDPKRRVPPEGSAPAFDMRWQAMARWLVGVAIGVVLLLAAVDGVGAVLEAVAAVF